MATPVLGGNGFIGSYVIKAFQERGEEVACLGAALGTVGSYQLYELAYCKNAPKAIINLQADPIVTIGAIISNIPMVDQLDRNPLEVIKTGDFVEVDADQGIVRVKLKSS